MIPTLTPRTYSGSDIDNKSDYDNSEINRIIHSNINNDIISRKDEKKRF
jgi:hypothetical protein